jgi:hypothetical protein
MKNISFEFIEEYGPEQENLDTLSKVQIEQLKACLILYYGEEDAERFDVSDMTTWFDEDLEGWGYVELYHIINEDTKEIMFDFWCYNADSGTIFIHDKAEHIGIFMIQFDFDLAEKNAFNKSLPENFTKLLQDAFDKK